MYQEVKDMENKAWRTEDTCFECGNDGMIAGLLERRHKTASVWLLCPVCMYTETCVIYTDQIPGYILAP